MFGAQLTAYGLLRLYGPPDGSLLKESSKTLYSVKQLPQSTGLRVVSVKSIEAVVAVIPRDPLETGADAEWFVWERMGLDISMLQDLQEEYTEDI
jgi:hypothetical protein